LVLNLNAPGSFVVLHPRSSKGKPEIIGITIFLEGRILLDVHDSEHVDKARHKVDDQHQAQHYSQHLDNEEGVGSEDVHLLAIRLELRELLVQEAFNVLDPLQDIFYFLSHHTDSGLSGIASMIADIIEDLPFLVGNDSLVSDSDIRVKVNLSAIRQGIKGMITTMLLLIIRLSAVNEVANTATLQDDNFITLQQESGGIDILALRVTLFIDGSRETFSTNASVVRIRLSWDTLGPSVTLVLALVASRKFTTIDLFDGHITEFNRFVLASIGNDVADLVSTNVHDGVFHQSWGNSDAHPQSFLLGVADGETFLTVGIALVHKLRVITPELDIRCTSKRSTLLAITSVTFLTSTVEGTFGVCTVGVRIAVVDFPQALIDIYTGISVIGLLEALVAIAFIATLVVDAMRVFRAGVAVREGAFIQIDALLAVSDETLITNTGVTLGSIRLDTGCMSMTVMSLMCAAVYRFANETITLETVTAFALIAAFCVGTLGVRVALVERWALTLINVGTDFAITFITFVACANEATLGVGTIGVLVTVSETKPAFVNICALKAVPGESWFALAKVTAVGVDAVCVDGTSVDSKFALIYIHHVYNSLSTF